MIGVYDSGCGGLSVLRELLRLMPEERFLYYADNAHCPYGEKQAEYILDRGRTITGILLERGVDIIVVACNTATGAAVASLRKECSDACSPSVRERVRRLSGGRRDHVRFIGMEPAVKPAALGTKTGVIGVLATEGTLKASKYLATKENYSDGCRIEERVGKGFVELVERGVLDGSEAEAVVRDSLCPLLDAGADTIVLGCTHYPFLLPLMQRIAGNGVRFIDPAPAVARQTLNVMREDGLFPVVAPAGHCIVPDACRVTLLSSGDQSPVRRLFSLITLG